MIKFSFIILFHNNNSTDYVVDSILSQFIAGDEIIVVNDHSNPDTLKIFDRFKEKIQIVHSDVKGNRGYNRNYGAKFAHNEYLMFVDGDIIFLPGSIMAMRESMGRGYIGAVGNVVCGKNTIPQMNLISGTDYLNLVRNHLSWETIIQLGLLKDNRQGRIFDKIALNNVWEYFYSAYCAVKKIEFDTIGGFETEFVGWGVEDDEFGYRLHLQGPLEYNHSAYGIHVPHMRDLYKCLMSNRINLYRFLAKFPTNQLELHLTFEYTIKLNFAIDYIKKQLFSLRTYVYDFLHHEKSIYINELTEAYPNGYIQFDDSDNNLHILELFGLALPFKNNNFEYAYCTENLFVYPELFFSPILSEMLRVAKEVRILKIETPIRTVWNDEMLSGLANMSSAKRVVYTPSWICDFDILDCGSYYKITDGIASKMNEHFILNDNFYHPEYFKEPPKHYILINLTNCSLSLDKKSLLETEYNIIIDTCYNISVDLDTSDICLSKVLFGDLYRLHSHMAYLIPEGYSINKSDVWWDYIHRNLDLVIQNT